MKIILCGYHWTGCKALDLLQGQGHEVFVYTHESPYHVPDLADLCQRRGVPYSLQNVSHADLPFIPDVVCSIYYRYMIGPHVIEACSGKIFNLHPSLLPKYRGCSSITWAMINGESETGFTYHYIDAGCDSGDIIIQGKIAIEEWDDQSTLYQRVMFGAMSYFPEVLDRVVAGQNGVPQQGEATYHKRGCPHNGVIDSGWEPDYIRRFIRAMSNPPYPPATFQGNYVYCYDDYLRIIESRPEPAGARHQQ